MKLVKFTLPSFWASYLVNGDASGLDDHEIKAIDRWLDANNLSSPLGYEDVGFYWHNDGPEGHLGGDCMGFTFEELVTFP